MYFKIAKETITLDFMVYLQGTMPCIHGFINCKAKSSDDFLRVCIH